MARPTSQRGGWLYGIARNLVRRYHRRGRVELATCPKLGTQLDHDPDELAEIESQIDRVGPGLLDL